MITEIAIVISAWRRSSPWFQRRKRLLDDHAEHANYQAGEHQRDQPPEEPYSDAEPVGEARLRFSPWVSS